MDFDELTDTVKEEDVTLELDEGRVTLVSFDDGGILAMVRLGELPEGALTALCRDMMAANHLFQETDGATLSLEPGTRQAFLQRLCRVQGEGEDAFLNRLAVLVQKAEEWRARLFGGDGENRGAEAPDSDGLFSGDTILFRV